MRAASSQLGLSPAFAGVLPRGEAELVEHYVAKCNRALEQRLADGVAEFRAQGMTARIKQAVRMRLEMLIPHIGVAGSG